MAINSRDKGARGERELANILKKHGFDSRRGQQYSGANGDADVVGVEGLHIECKRVDKLQLSKAMEQAKHDANDGEIPVVMHRRNREKWNCTIGLDDFLKIYKKFLEVK